MTALWLLTGIVALLYAGGCRRGVPAVDPGAQPQAARGTITGLVHAPGEALAGRTVEAVNVASGEILTTRTAANGGFRIEAPKGRYRVELELHGGETIAARPDVVDLDRAGNGSPIEFVVMPAHTAHRPVYRVDNGLGSPMA